MLLLPCHHLEGDYYQCLDDDSNEQEVRKVIDYRVKELGAEGGKVKKRGSD